MGQREGDKVGGVEVSPWSLPRASRRHRMEHEKSQKVRGSGDSQGGLGRHLEEIHQDSHKDHGLQVLQEQGLPSLPVGLD